MCEVIYPQFHADITSQFKPVQTKIIHKQLLNNTKINIKTSKKCCLFAMKTVKMTLSKAKT